MYTLLLSGIPFNHLSRDPFEVLDGPSYVGFISTVDVIFGAAAATVCFLGYLVQQREKHASFFLFAAVFSSILMLDDAFGMHDRAAPAVGVPELLLQAFYGCLLVTFLLRFGRFIGKTEFGFLLLACLGLGLSMSVDVLMEAGGVVIPHPYVLEDGFKLFGIMSWLLYFHSTFRGTPQQAQVVEGSSEGNGCCAWKAFTARVECQSESDLVALSDLPYRIALRS